VSNISLSLPEIIERTGRGILSFDTGYEQIYVLLKQHISEEDFHNAERELQWTSPFMSRYPSALVQGQCDALFELFLAYSKRYNYTSTIYYSMDVSYHDMLRLFP
jgi:hypothetical protein